MEITNPINIERMKKVIKKVENEVSVVVCDICENEDCVINWSWSENCPYDGCSSDWGKANFCSTEHFLEGVRRSKLGLSSDDDFNDMRFTLEVEGNGISSVTEILAKLENYADSNK